MLFMYFIEMWPIDIARKWILNLDPSSGSDPFFKIRTRIRPKPIIYRVNKKKRGLAANFWPLLEEEKNLTSHGKQ